MTVPELVGLLEAQPATALAAIERSKIAGPREFGPFSSARYNAKGKPIGRIFGIEGCHKGYENADHIGPKRSDPPESHRAFAARVDAALRAAGWVLVDR